MKTPIKEHPTVIAHQQRPAPEKVSEPLDDAWLRQLCLDAGADDVGFVEIDRPALAEERPHIQRAFPHTRSLISIVQGLKRDDAWQWERAGEKSGFQQPGAQANEVAKHVAGLIERAGI